MDKKAVVHICNGILAIKKTGFELILMRWMNLEPVVQSEVSQREKQILYINAYMESKKHGTDETVCFGEADVENGLVNTEGGMKMG